MSLYEIKLKYNCFRPRNLCLGPRQSRKPWTNWNRIVYTFINCSDKRINKFSDKRSNKCSDKRSNKFSDKISNKCFDKRSNKCPDKRSNKCSDKGMEE